MKSARALALLALGYTLAAGCGDVTGDLIVRNQPAPETIACSGDADCAAPTPRCELATGSCVDGVCELITRAPAANRSGLPDL